MSLWSTLKITPDHKRPTKKKIDAKCFPGWFKSTDTYKIYIYREDDRKVILEFTREQLEVLHGNISKLLNA